ncbi:MAG: GatB/YqeY domain-containing protein [Flavobacteriaceae bacterium]|jgi:uncharacterized protein YqeY|nr:GatB/YqeY domain-containing protein [Flavobacteriaceae bacterium]
MSLKDQVMEQIKNAMRSKDTVALESLRAIKSELLLLETSGSSGEVSEEQEIKLLQKLVKQRKESAETYAAQGRTDLAEPELAQAQVISAFLPKQLGEDEIKLVVARVAHDIGAVNMADMGKLMGAVSKELAGQADGKTISSVVKAYLS